MPVQMELQIDQLPFPLEMVESGLFQFLLHIGNQTAEF
jgi:hypothetical protein